MFYLLLTLVDGESHGYAMGRAVRERSAGSVDLGPAKRRRYYRLTKAGRDTLDREADTWEQVLSFARSKNIGGQEAR